MPQWEAMAEIATAQADCLTQGACPDPIPLPAVFGETTGASNTTTAADSTPVTTTPFTTTPINTGPTGQTTVPVTVPTTGFPAPTSPPLPTVPPTAALADDGAYTSPTYGYAISWDPAVWTNAGDYVGSFDSLTLQSELATFMLTGTDAYDDLPACLSGAIAGFQIGDFAPAEGIAGPTPAAGAAAALMTADLPQDDGTVAEAVAYFECRWVEEGESTLTVTLLAGAEGFAEVLQIYEDLIAGLEVPGATAVGSVPVSTAPVTISPVGPTTVLPTTSGQPGAPAAGYVRLQDDTGLLTVEVPDTWTEVDLRPDQADDGTVRPLISASPDTQSFLETFDTPGVLYVAFPAGSDLNELLRFYDWPAEFCQDTGIRPYDDGLFTGSLQTWTNCGGGAASATFVAANPPTNEFTAWLYVQTVTPAEDPALQHILETFNYHRGVGLPPPGAPVAGSTPVTTMPLTTTAITTGPAAQTTVPVPIPPTTGASAPTSPPFTTVSSAPEPVTTLSASAGSVDPTSEAVVLASMLQPADVSASADTSGISPDDDVDLPGWAENGGIRSLGQTVSDDAITVFDFRWQFPDAASATAFLDAAEADLSEVSFGSVPATAPVNPLGDTRYYTFRSELFGVVLGYNYLMRHENLVAKVYVSGAEGDVTEEDAARIAQIAGERIIAALSGQAPPTGLAGADGGRLRPGAQAAPTSTIAMQTTAESNLPTAPRFSAPAQRGAPTRRYVRLADDTRLLGVRSWRRRRRQLRPDSREPHIGRDALHARPLRA